MIAEHPTFCLCIPKLDGKCNTDHIIIFDSSDFQGKPSCNVFWACFFLRHFPIACKGPINSGEGIAKLQGSSLTEKEKSCIYMLPEMPFFLYGIVLI